MSPTPQQSATPTPEWSNTERDGWRDITSADATAAELRLVYWIFGPKPEHMDAFNWRNNMRACAEHIREHVAAQLAAKEQELAEAREKCDRAVHNELVMATAADNHRVHSQELQQQLTARDATIEGLREALKQIAEQQLSADLSADDYVLWARETAKFAAQLPPLPSAVPNHPTIREKIAAIVSGQNTAFFAAEWDDLCQSKDPQTADFIRGVYKTTDAIIAAFYSAVPVHPDTARLITLLEHMLLVAENADETGYVTDAGFVDVEKLHAEVRAAIDAARQSTGEQGT